MLIVLALLFWFGYKAPIIIVQLWENPWQNLQIVIGPAHGPRARPGRLHRAHVPLVPARGHPRGLRAHGARQGRRGAARGAAPRPAQRAPARHHDLGRAPGLRAGRLGGRRAGLRRARPRPRPRHRGDRARHHRGAEPRAALRADLRGRERPRRPELRVARSAHPLCRARPLAPVDEPSLRELGARFARAQPAVGGRAASSALLIVARRPRGAPGSRRATRSRPTSGG